MCNFFVLNHDTSTKFLNCEKGFWHGQLGGKVIEVTRLRVNYASTTRLVDYKLRKYFDRGLYGDPKNVHLLDQALKCVRIVSPAAKNKWPRSA